MQCGAGARPEWSGKRLVALKRMKRVWEGGWRQARNLGELVVSAPVATQQRPSLTTAQSLRSIPSHPAVIPLYDAFISPRSRELYFVFECMEGNLYQLTKSRKGRPLAAGLIASCFHQVVSGLYHIHQYGYFHRDMKPENLLVTTTGLCDYLSTSALNEINARRASGQTDDIQLMSGKIEKDVQVIVKLADFGLARAIASKPPYTEYVSTRWYRAPEVLLRSTEYGAPVDMWALGTILAEMVNLKPLFPGVSEIDQVYRICDTLGDPSTDYGYDERGRAVGGGVWTSGVKLAKNVGFSFPKSKPVNFRSLFPAHTPQSLIDCIGGLMRYNPKYRMTSAQCMDHAYFHETLPHLQHVPPLPRIPFAQGQPVPNQQAQPRPVQTDINAAARPVPQPTPQPHAHHVEARPPPPVYPTGDMRALPPPVEIQTPDSAPVQNGHPPPQIMYHRPPPMHREGSGNYGSSPLVHQLRELDLPTEDLASYGQRRWADEQALSASRRPSATVSVSNHYDGSTVGSANSSNPGFNPHALSATNLQRVPSQQQPHQQQQQHQVPNPHVAAYVRQQQQQAYQQQALRQVTQSTPNLTPAPSGPSTPRVAAQSTMALTGAVAQMQHPQTHQSHQQPRAPPMAQQSKLALSGKKKKWGLSSVFGGGDKNDSSSALAPVDETGYAHPTSSSSSLKRTQSGHYADERALQPIPQITLDPKKAKKEAEREARELALAKREAAERAQKERARAVLQKRSQLLAQNSKSNGAGEIEFSEPPPASLAAKQSSGNLRGYPSSHAAKSAASVASARSHTSGVSPYGTHLEAYGSESGRNKARKTAEDDDHSSIGRTSLQSRSLLSVGTVDSDQASRRGEHWGDPSRRAPSMASAHRHPNMQPHSTTSLMTHSTASLESQLASQLARQATVASASDSSLSLGRRAGRSVSQHQQLHLDPRYRQAELPGAPHAHHHSGMPHPSAPGENQMLPSIDTLLPGLDAWAEGPQYTQMEINPMFRIPYNTKQ